MFQSPAGALQLSGRCRDAISTKGRSCPLIGCLPSLMSQGWFIKRPTDSAAWTGQAWRRTEPACLHVGAYRRGRSVCVCARVPHESRRRNLRPERRSRRRRGKRMMVLCAAGVKVSGLTPYLDQSGGDTSWRWAARCSCRFGGTHWVPTVA